MAQRKPEPDMTPDDLIRLGHEPKTPLQALRAHCLDCSGFEPGEVRQCTVTSCPSWPFRFGRSPWRKPATQAQRDASRRNARHLRKPRENHETEALPTIPPDGS
jgi:hypothetical protein